MTMDSEQTESILDELKQTFDSMDYTNVDSFIQMLKKARHIVCAGVGREGLTCRAFCMRLMHLGFDSHWVWDDTAPALGTGDLFVFTCGSGEIAHLLTIARLAKDAGASVVCCTGVPGSTAASVADLTIFIPATVFKGQGDLVPSLQPMGTLWETASWVFFDSLVYEIHKEEGISYSSMTKRHRNYE